MTVTIAQLPLATLRALADGDAAAAARLSPVPLSAWLSGPECRSTWVRRAKQVAVTPEDVAWVTGVVLADGVPVGRAGFHAAPDPEGTVEVGYAIDPDHRRRGHAQAALAAMLDRAREADDVRRVLASVGPWNAHSLQMVRARGFVVIGEEMDDEDGLELVHALDVEARPVGATGIEVVVANRGALVPLIARSMLERRAIDWLHAFEKAGVPAGPINDLQSVFEDPQIRHRGMRSAMAYDDRFLERTTCTDMTR